MPISLLNTKFYYPTPTGRWVERGRLLSRLNEYLIVGNLLTLVSAPAGYGKSTLVGAWMAHIAQPAAWLSLDDIDDEPGRFMLYFIAAIQRIEPAFCTELFAALQAGQIPSVEVLVTTLVNAMLGWDLLHILVLDDFHHIQDQTILDTLAGIFTQQPPNFHLVLITREDPPLPLARLRALGQLTEIRAADLRFSETEASQMLRDRLGLELPAGDVARLTERTEGWVAGLQLAGLSLQGRENPGAFVQTLSGSHRFILDYLTEEALKTQPLEVQAFLLETSILPQLSGELCNAVTGHPDSAALLERLLADNLFIIPLDDDGHWYRYHHLFAELLQHKLRLEHPEYLAELHRRASRWQESMQNPAAAIEHGLAAGEHARVLTLFEAHRWQLLNQGHLRAMERWMEAIPMDLRAGAPGANLGFAWAHLLRGNFGQVGFYLEAAQAATLSQALQADMLALQANLAQTQGQISDALALAEKSLALAPPENTRLVGLASLALGAAYRQMGHFEQSTEILQTAMRASQSAGDSVTAMLAVAHLALMSLQTGRLHFLAETAKQAIARTEAAGTAPPMIGAVHVALGMVYYEWGRSEPARQALLRGIRLATVSGHNASLLYGKVHLSRLLLSENDLSGAEASLREASELLAQGAPAWGRADWAVQKVSLLLAQGNLPEAEAVLRASGVNPETPVTHQTDGLHLAWLRYLSATHHPGALPLAGRIADSAETGRRFGTLIYALVLGAQVGGSSSWLARARQLGEPEGYHHVFVDEALAEKPVVAEGLIEPLTERELEVLRLLAEGLTYAQMAERLVVSVNTVRYHVKGVYGKLGAEKQTQAVERGRELGLI